MRPTPRAVELSIPVKGALNNLEFALSTINFSPETAEKLYRISISDDVAPLIIPNLVSFLQKNLQNHPLELGQNKVQQQSSYLIVMILILQLVDLKLYQTDLDLLNFL